MAGRRASRAVGLPRSQHFLRSSALAAEIVVGAGIGPGHVAVDLGAGTGRLTDALARVAHRVIAVELDPHLAARLRDRWSNVEVIAADAAQVALPQEPFRVVANLPFHRTAELLHRLLDDPRVPLERADVIVEWAVAHKYAVPWPSSVKGVVWGAHYEAGVARRLPSAAFAPPPSVDAGLLVFRRRSQPLVPPNLSAGYHRFVAAGFRHGLRAVVSRRELRRIGTGATTARELDAHQWATLFLRRSASVPTTRTSSR